MNTKCFGAGVVLAVGLALVSCSNAAGPKPELAIVMAPADAVMRGTFELVVSANDASGTPRPMDDTTVVTVKLVSGHGTLGGTHTQTLHGGMARFADLTYDTWEPIELQVTAPGFGAATTSPITVRPVMRLADVPTPRARLGAPIGPFRVEVVDAMGTRIPAPDKTVTLSSTQAGAVIAGGPDRMLIDGTATWDSVQLMTAGNATLVWQSPDLDSLMQGLLVYDMLSTQTLWLRAGRVGVPYAVTLAAGTYALADTALPAGLTLDTASGSISGTPTEAKHTRFHLQSTDSTGLRTLWLIDLSIFPQVETPAVTLDDLDHDGPFMVQLLTDSVSVPSRGVSEAIRILVPSAAGGAVADGLFPVVVFHHGFAWTSDDFPKIYDRFDSLLRRWASYGFIVVSVDGEDLMFIGGSHTSYTGLSIDNLTGISENQRAAIEWLKQANDTPSSPLRGHVDVDRFIVSGHSRGGGGSVISAAMSPDVMGAILLKPIDPFMSPGGDVAWSAPLPNKPILLTIGGNDGDVEYPIPDFLYERHAGAISAHTILGTIHNFSMDVAGTLDDAEVGPRGLENPEIEREEDHAITNAYAIAFLRYVAYGDIRYAPLLFGHDALSTSLSPLGALVRGDRAAQTAIVVDDFADGAADTNALHHANTATGFTSSMDQPSMLGAIATLPRSDSGLRALYSRPTSLAFSNAHALAWSYAGAVYRTALGNLDVSGRGELVFRARSDAGQLSGDDVKITFYDAVGHSSDISGSRAVGANGFAERFSDAVVSLADVAAGGADLHQLTAIELTFGAASGNIVIDDLRFE